MSLVVGWGSGWPLVLGWAGLAGARLLAAGAWSLVLNWSGLGCLGSLAG